MTRAYHDPTGSGYTGTITETAYGPFPASAPPPLPLLGRTTFSCDLNPATDALVAVTFTVRNTTANFPAYAQVMMNGPPIVDSETWSAIGLTNVRSDTVIGAQPQCVDRSTGGGDLFYNALWNSVPPGGTVGDSFWWVIDGYYSPAHPNGDPAALKTDGAVFDSGDGIVGMGAAR